MPLGSVNHSVPAYAVAALRLTSLVAPGVWWHDVSLVAKVHCLMAKWGADFNVPPDTKASNLRCPWTLQCTHIIVTVLLTSVN